MTRANPSEGSRFALIEDVRRCLRLLSPADRVKLYWATAAQMATSLLDLVGVVLLGVVAALLVAAISGGALALPGFPFLDLLQGQSLGALRLAMIVAIAAGCILLLKSGLNIWISRRILLFLAQRQASVSSSLALKLFSQPLGVVQVLSSQQTAFGLIPGVTSAMLNVIGQATIAASELALLAVLGTALLFLDPVITILSALFFSAVGVWLYRLMSQRAGDAGARITQADIESMQLVQELISTFREIFVTNRRSFYVERFSDMRWHAASTQAQLSFLSVVPKYVFEMAIVVGAALLGLTQFLLKDALAAATGIAIVLAAASRIVPSLLRLQSAALIIRGQSGVAETTLRLVEVMEDQGRLGEVPGVARTVVVADAGVTDLLVPRVEVSAVTVVYPATGLTALTDASLHIEPGWSVALVGPTGAGKSTLTDVILGVTETSAGSVKIGGLTPREAISTWPGSFGYVPQDVRIVNGTVRDNVALGLPPAEISDEAVLEALRRAHLDRFLDSQRDGISTYVGEGGLRLSGGQRQRLGIARALYSKPRLLVLDEATSALDAETEEAIVQTFRDLAGAVTTVTIAHRLPTVRDCTLVVYLDGGRIIASGTFDDVRSQVPAFDRQARLMGLE